MNNRKILVVDDELPIREWLQFRIQKEFPENVEVLTAGNGQEALDIFLQYKPDIIFTDIKMPKMDGLELVKKVREIDSHTYIVILTSYNDFEYARTAFSYHANDYILKTEISSSLLKQIINRADTNKTQPTSNAPRIIYSIEDICTAVSSFRRDQIPSPVLGPDFSLPSTAYFCFAIQVSQERVPNIPTEPLIKRLLFAEYDADKYLGIMEISSEESTLRQTNELLHYIQVLQNLNEDAFISYSLLKQPSENVEKAIKRVAEMLSTCFYTQNTLAGEQDYTPSNDTASMNELNTIYLSIIQHIRQNNEHEITRSIDIFFTRLKDLRPVNIPQIKVICERICSTMLSVFAPTADQELYSQLHLEIMQSKTFDDLYASVMSNAERILSTRPLQDSENLYIQNALQYISINYATISSIGEVAEFVNLKSDVFSRLFKEQTGVSFNAYLNDYRLNKAAALIENTDQNLSSIAESVGFSSLSYFSKCFKKLYGVSPFNYKRTN